MSKRSCDTCTALNKHGKRCTRVTCIYGPKCWQHTQLQDHLEVKQSSIAAAGKGLFAKKEFKKDAIIAPYGGKVLSKAELDRKYPGDKLAPYALQAGKNKFIDAKRTNSGVARYANDCRTANSKAKQCKGNNARLTGKNLKASKKIKNGSEIFAGYGPSYWRAAR
jgi:hypothetical protein